VAWGYYRDAFGEQQGGDAAPPCRRGGARAPLPLRAKQRGERHALCLPEATGWGRRAPRTGRAAPRRASGRRDACTGILLRSTRARPRARFAGRTSGEPDEPSGSGGDGKASGGGAGAFGRAARLGLLQQRRRQEAEQRRQLEAERQRQRQQQQKEQEWDWEWDQPPPPDGGADAEAAPRRRAARAARAPAAAGDGGGGDDGDGGADRAARWAPLTEEQERARKLASRRRQMLQTREPGGTAARGGAVGPPCVSA
jgi:hypothetical protein